MNQLRHPHAIVFGTAADIQRLAEGPWTVRCINCDIEWDPNFDPPKCEAMDHGHQISTDNGMSWSDPYNGNGDLVHR